jgi:hypothetical protein
VVEEWRAAVGGDFTGHVIVGHDLQRIEIGAPLPKAEVVNGARGGTTACDGANACALISACPHAVPNNACATTSAAAARTR